MFQKDLDWKKTTNLKKNETGRKSASGEDWAPSLRVTLPFIMVPDCHLSLNFFKKLHFVWL